MHMFIFKVCFVVVANLGNRLMAKAGSEIKAAPALIVDNEQGGRVLRLLPFPKCVCVCVRVCVCMSESERKGERNSVKHRE